MIRDILRGLFRVQLFLDLGGQVELVVRIGCGGSTLKLRRGCVLVFRRHLIQIITGTAPLPCPSIAQEVI